MSKIEVGFVISITVAVAAWGGIAWLSLPSSDPVSTDVESSLLAEEIADDLQIAIVGKKFEWNFRYPGQDGQLNTPDDVQSNRKLHLPPGRRVKFHVLSEDYVYILGIPLNENGSPDVQETGPGKIRELAVPSLTRFMEHQFEKTGTYDLMVDPLCGFQSIHDPLMGQIVVSDTHDFTALYPRAEKNPKNPL